MAVRALNVIQFRQSEKTKREVALDRSMDDLVAAMRELVLVEKMTGRTGLPQRICLAYSETLMDAMRLAGVK